MVLLSQHLRGRNSSRATWSSRAALTSPTPGIMDSCPSRSRATSVSRNWGLVNDVGTDTFWTQKCPKCVQRVEKCPKHVQNVSNICPKYVQLYNVSKTCPRSVQSGMKCPKLLDIFWTSSGQVSKVI